MSVAAEPPNRDWAASPDDVVVERELQMISEAIALVANGDARRVVVANIRFGSLVLDAVRRPALEQGIRIRPLWREDMEADLAVERING